MLAVRNKTFWKLSIVQNMTGTESSEYLGKLPSSCLFIALLTSPQCRTPASQHTSVVISHIYYILHSLKDPQRETLARVLRNSGGVESTTNVLEMVHNGRHSSAVLSNLEIVPTPKGVAKYFQWGCHGL